MNGVIVPLLSWEEQYRRHAKTPRRPTQPVPSQRVAKAVALALKSSQVTLNHRQAGHLAGTVLSELGYLGYTVVRKRKGD